MVTTYWVLPLWKASTVCEAGIRGWLLRGTASSIRATKRASSIAALMPWAGKKPWAALPVASTRTRTLPGAPMIAELYMGSVTIQASALSPPAMRARAPAE